MATFVVASALLLCFWAWPSCGAPTLHESPQVSGVCDARGRADGSCVQAATGSGMLQRSASSVLSEQACESTTYDVETCPDGYSLPSWAWTIDDLETECVDKLDFGREVGEICRNTNFNVGKAIIVVHGKDSHRSEMWSQNGGWGNFFLQRGYVVFSIDYKSGDCEVDIANASTFLQDAGNMPSEDFVIDPGNIGVFGYSLGGICASRSAIFEAQAQQATVCLSGSVDGGPLKKVTSDAPPTLILWGNEDCTEEVTQGDAMYEKFLKKGIDVGYHVFDAEGMKNSHTKVAKTYPCSMEYATNFFDAQLGNTLEAPTSAPTVTTTTEPTPAPEKKGEASWEVHTEGAKCNNGSQKKTMDDLDACLALALENGVTYASFRASDGKCMAFESTCTVKETDGWTIYQVV